MVSYNDLGVPVHELPMAINVQHNKQCNAYLDQRLKTISNYSQTQSQSINSCYES